MAPLTKKLHSFLRRRIICASKHWWAELRLHINEKMRKLKRTKFDSVSPSYNASENDHQSLSELQHQPRNSVTIVDVSNGLIFAWKSEDANAERRETTATIRCRGGCRRQNRHPQFRPKFEPDSSISRSSLLISQTRSVGAFEVLFPRDSYPATFASALQQNSLSASGIQRDKHRFLTHELSRSSCQSPSSTSEDIWSTTVLSPAPRILSSTPIKR